MNRGLWLVLLSLAAPSAVQAEAYPWVPSQDEVRLVADPRMDLEVRLYMIRQARRNLDVVIYEQGDDEAVGLPVLSAIRDAANRGVKVRIITQWFFQYITHPFNQSPAFTTNPPTAVPIEYVVFGSPSSVLSKGWEPSDGIHGKLMIVDQAWAITTGRSHADSYLRWVDASYLLKGALKDQSIQAFNRLWDEAKRAGEVYRPTFQRDQPTPEQGTQHLPILQARLGPARQTELQEHVAWLYRPPVLRPPEDGPKGRLLHYDFVAQMEEMKRNKQRPKDYKERIARLQDPVVDAVAERLERAGPGDEVRLTIMYAIMHPRVRDAVVAAQQRGAQVTLFTNGELVAPPITTVAFLAGVEDLMKVVNSGASVYKFSSMSGKPWNFLHLKLMVVGKTVLFGSHNLNLPSSVANDEINFQVEDPALAEQMRQLFDAYVRSNGERITKSFISPQLPLGPVSRWLLEPVLGFY